jgi:hypothetical protein
VLNKIDTLADPLLGAAQVEDQIQQQCAQAAQTLGVEAARVFPLSARQALTARVQGDEAGLAASRLPALEHALTTQLLPQRVQVVGRMVRDCALALQQAAQRRLQDRQVQVAEQLAELCNLRGKSAGRLQLVAGRLDAEGLDFERCAPRLAALRSVLQRQLQDLQAGLGSEPLREAVARMCDDSGAGLLKLGAARAFAAMDQGLRERLTEADRRVDEIALMLHASQRALNAEFGFALHCAPRPALDGYARELARIAHSYSRHVSLTQRWRLSQPGFMARFSQMLLARLRVVFEGAAGEIEHWAKGVGNQIDDQLRERRQAVLQRRDAHARIRSAEDGLERSITELEADAARWQRLAERLAADVDSLRALAATPPVADAQPRAPHLQLVLSPPQQPLPARGAA